MFYEKRLTFLEKFDILWYFLLKVCNVLTSYKNFVPILFNNIFSIDYVIGGTRAYSIWYYKKKKYCRDVLDIIFVGKGQEMT